VFNVLLQVMDDGRLTDGQGRTVDFKNTVLIMTSNVGSQFIVNEADEESMRAESRARSGSYFKPEFPQPDRRRGDLPELSKVDTSRSSSSRSSSSSAGCASADRGGAHRRSPRAAREPSGYEPDHYGGPPAEAGGSRSGWWILGWRWRTS
jgi:hypothetical protein